MSVQTVRDFIKHAESTPRLQAQLDSIPKGQGEKTLDQLVKLGATAGYTFSAEDYKKAVTELLAQKHAAGALSYDELCLIMGGLQID
jgi:predicted ribosomally synthesized peptide with nif11-like leader